MIDWLKQRSFPTRVLLYAAAAILAFAVAAGIGAMMTLMMQGDSSQRQGADADRSQQQKAAGQQDKTVVQKTTPHPQEDGGQQKETASPQDEAQYLSKIRDIQANSVETVLDSHDSVLRYDSLTAADVEDMQFNQAALQVIKEQVANIDPPQKYREQHEVFSSAISELYEAARLAYNLAADPVSATQSKFDEYDRHVDDAAALLQRSNEILGRDYENLQDAQDVSPS